MVSRPSAMLSTPALAVRKTFGREPAVPAVESGASGMSIQARGASSASAIQMFPSGPQIEIAGAAGRTEGIKDLRHH